MKAIAIVPGTAGSRLVERPEPSITAQDEIKIRIIRVGICGTDREEVSGGRADAPDGQKELVIGHEMFGQVVGVGSSVTRVKPGDYAVFTVRRGCGESLALGICCALNRLADFRGTAQNAKDRERLYLDGMQDQLSRCEKQRMRIRLEYRRIRTDLLGERTRLLLYLQITAFVLGALVLISAFAAAYPAKIL